VSYRGSAEGPDTVLATVKGNHQRLNRLTFAPVEARALRITIHATNGDPIARVFEVRCYGQAPGQASIPSLRLDVRAGLSD